MHSAKNAGRVIGLALLVQLVLAPPVYAWLIRPGTARDFLADAAASATQIRVGLLLTFVLGAMTLVIAIVAMPVLRRYSDAMAMTLFALALANVGTLTMDSVGVRSLLTLSLEYAKPGTEHDLLGTLGGLARASWISAHYTNLMFGHLTIFALFVALYRFALVPRALSAFGLAASALSTVTVTSPLLGTPLPFRLVMPMGLASLALLLWLLVRGLAEQPPGVPREATPLELARV